MNDGQRRKVLRPHQHACVARVAAHGRLEDEQLVHPLEVPRHRAGRAVHLERIARLRPHGGAARLERPEDTAREPDEAPDGVLVLDRRSCAVLGEFSAPTIAITRKWRRSCRRSMLASRSRKKNAKS